MIRAKVERNRCEQPANDPETSRGTHPAPLDSHRCEPAGWKWNRDQDSTPHADFRGFCAPCGPPHWLLQPLNIYKRDVWTVSKTSCKAPLHSRQSCKSSYTSMPAIALLIQPLIQH